MHPAFHHQHPPSFQVRQHRQHTGIGSVHHLAMAALCLFCCALALIGAPIASASALDAPHPLSYRCEGEPLTALLVRGGVDDPSLPDPSSSPVPIGGFVVLQWRDQHLQLPRTNNAGPASFTDGRWWWSLEDPHHPRFRLRRAIGDIEDFACTAVS